MGDRNFESYAGQTNLTLRGPRTIDGSAYDDALKFSNCTGVLVDGLTIIGGREDCIDINRGGAIEIVRSALSPKGRYAFTIKGGARGITLSDLVLHSHGKTADIEIGQWSDQSQERNPPVWVNRVRMADGSAVRIRVWHADRPVCVDGSYKVQVVPRIIVWAYFTWKKLLRALGR